MLPAKQLKAPLLIALKLKKTKSDRLWNRSRRNRSKFHNRHELVTEEVVKKIFNDAEKSKPKSNSFPLQLKFHFETDPLSSDDDGELSDERIWNWSNVESIEHCCGSRRKTPDSIENLALKGPGPCRWDEQKCNKSWLSPRPQTWYGHSRWQWPLIFPEL